MICPVCKTIFSIVEMDIRKTQAEKQIRSNVELYRSDYHCPHCHAFVFSEYERVDK